MKLEEVIDKAFIILPFVLIAFIIFYVLKCEFACTNFSFEGKLRQEIRQKPLLLG